MWYCHGLRWEQGINAGKIFIYKEPNPKHSPRSGQYQAGSEMSEKHNSTWTADEQGNRGNLRSERKWGIPVVN